MYLIADLTKITADEFYNLQLKARNHFIYALHEDTCKVDTEVLTVTNANTVKESVIYMHYFSGSFFIPKDCVILDV